MRVLVCGGRDFDNADYVFSVLNRKHKQRQFDTVILGCEKGVDEATGQWVEETGLESVKFPADWGRHGAAAGFVRNQKMLTETRPDLVLAFPGGAGTNDVVFRAKAAGIEVIEVPRPIRRKYR